MAGTIVASTVDSGTASTVPVFKANGTEIGTLCRAWVNFNGVSTATVRASFNVSSVVRNGTGDYTINFSSAMPDSNYAVSTNRTNQIGVVGGLFGEFASASAPTRTASSIRIMSMAGTSSYQDDSSVSISVFR